MTVDGSTMATLQKLITLHYFQGVWNWARIMLWQFIFYKRHQLNTNIPGAYALKIFKANRKPYCISENGSPQFRMACYTKLCFTMLYEYTTQPFFLLPVNIFVDEKHFRVGINFKLNRSILFKIKKRVYDAKIKKILLTLISASLYKDCVKLLTLLTFGAFVKQNDDVMYSCLKLYYSLWEWIFTH